MSDYDRFEDVDEEFDQQAIEEPESEEEEEEVEGEEPQEEEVFAEELEEKAAGTGQKTEDFLERIIKIPDPEKLIGIQKWTSLSSLQKEEIRRLLQFRYCIQNLYKNRLTKVPFNLKNLMLSAGEAHKGEEPIQDPDSHLAKMFKFLDETLISAYSLNPKKYSKEIFMHGIFMIQAVLLTSLASKKVIGILSPGAIDMILNDVFNALVRAILDPGEMVGSEIATGLAEPLSQMTLNTFHLAGNSEKSKMNLGMSRMQQLLSYAKTKTAIGDLYMFINFKPQDEKDFKEIPKIISKFNSVFMKDILEKIRVVQDPGFHEGKTLFKEDAPFLAAFLKSRGRLPGGLSLISAQVYFKEDELFRSHFTTFEAESSLLEQYPNLFIIHTGPTRFRLFLKASGDELSAFKYLIGEFYEVKLSGLDGIQGVDINEDKVEYRTSSSDYKIRTVNRLFARGVNFHGVLASRFIDGYNSTTNDIEETVKYLGINAGKETLYQEIRTVYKANGANPSPTLINTLVSAMTCRGFVVPINSIGMKLANSSVMQRMTFEKSEDVITDAAAYGKTEKVNETSNNIILGQPFQGGTNAFKLII